MTKTSRVINVIIGLITISFAFLLADSASTGLPVMVGLLGIDLFIKGVGKIIYYIQIARHMVGGRYILYLGVILMDLGAFSGSLVDSQAVLLISYISAASLFSRLVSLLRARESKTFGSRQWIFIEAYGIFSFLIAAAVIICAVYLHNTDVAVYACCLQLIVSALQRIAVALKKTSIVYIQ